jgi:tetratricopeptide (TPR) repeat protein
LPDDTTRTTDGASGPPPGPSGAHVPPRIGRYRILRVIGEGGMGTVYEAEQESPRRTVALKVIRPGFVTPSHLRRFEQESHLLGRLQHPGIAQVYEAGTADSGHGPQPYFAMELVRGETLERVAEAHRLDVRARLDLFARVCDAVHHAHQKGIVHRDLKPANILVDEAGQPKVLDFGVARATDSDVHATMHTEVGAIVGTLAYMSPEQVAADPTALDTRSDVYALGVVLYELLSGRLPYDLRQKGLTEAVRIIRDEDPTRLSMISPPLRGDVETITAKALSKERERRYASAAELAADIRRYLKDEPIVARPPTTSYQLRKFAARNRALVLGLAAVFVALLVGTGVSTWQAVRARRAERGALEARALAERKQKEAEAVTQFLMDMLSSVDPAKMKGRDVTVRQVLDDAAGRAASGALAAEPELEAHAFRTLGMTYRALGLYPEAEAQLRAALETEKKLRGRDDPAVARALNDVAITLQSRGDLDSPEPLLREAIAIWRKAGGPREAELATGLNNLGWLLSNRGEQTEAEQVLRESLALRRRVHGDASAEVAAVLDNLASVRIDVGDASEAEPLYREALAIRRTVLGPEHPEVAFTLDNLGELLRGRGAYDEAVPLYREALAIERKALGPEHPDVSVTLNNLALALRALGDLAGAEPLLREAVAIKRKTLSANHPGLAATLVNLASLLVDRGHGAEAEPLFREAVAIQERALPVRHPAFAWSLAGLGLCLIREDRPGEAEPLLREALSIREEKFPPDDWGRFHTQSVLGEALLGQRRFAAAEPLLLQGYEGLKDKAGAAPLRKQEAFERVGRLYDAWGKPELAAAWRANR